MNVNFIQTFAWLCVSLPLWGQQNLDSAYRTTGSAVVSAFEPQRAVLQISSAVILDGRKEAGYGVVISADGFILTKASEVEAVNKLSVTVDRQNYRDVEIKIVDPVWDVALIKIDAEGLVPVVYAETSDIPHGAWVVANGATSRKRRRAMAGVVSANAREIPATGGAALGVVLKAGAEDLEIEEVNEKSGAHDAGLQPGDILIAINQKPVSKIEDIAEILKECKAGSGVGVTYRRDDEEVTAAQLKTVSACFPLAFVPCISASVRHSLAYYRFAESMELQLFLQLQTLPICHSLPLQQTRGCLPMQ